MDFPLHFALEVVISHPTVLSVRCSFLPLKVFNTMASSSVWNHVSEEFSSSRGGGAFGSLGLSWLDLKRLQRKAYRSMSSLSTAHGSSSFFAWGSLSVVAVSYATYAAYSYAAANSSGKEEEEEHEAPPPSSPVLNTHTSLEHELERLRERNQVLENVSAAVFAHTPLKKTYKLTNKLSN